MQIVLKKSDKEIVFSLNNKLSMFWFLYVSCKDKNKDVIYGDGHKNQFINFNNSL
jgi:hypothetical protein